MAFHFYCLKADFFTGMVYQGGRMLDLWRGVENLLQGFHFPRYQASRHLPMRQILFPYFGWI